MLPHPGRKLGLTLLDSIGELVSRAGGFMKRPVLLLTRDAAKVGGMAPAAFQQVVRLSAVGYMGDELMLYE
jgi:hypothetical protein